MIKILSESKEYPQHIICDDGKTYYWIEETSEDLEDPRCCNICKSVDKPLLWDEEVGYEFCLDCLLKYG